MNTIIIIPARYKSSRFPGKPLVDILGETLIERVWKKCIKVLPPNLVYVATDDERIRDHCIDKDMQYIMTSENCLTGTDRVAEAYKKLGKKYDQIINVQGDEPLINPKDIIKIIEESTTTSKQICCGTCKIISEEEFRSPNIIKIIMNKNNELFYASRGAIPTNKDKGFKKAYKQVCIYSFSPESLEDFSKLEKTPLEEIEDIEFLRFLEIGYKIKMVEVCDSSIAVDIPSDVLKVEEKLIQQIDIKQFLENAKILSSKNIALDFDGVIHNNSKVFNNDGTINGEPVDGAIEFLPLISNIYNIVIYTCKASPNRPLINGKDGVGLVWEWLDRYDLKKYISEVTYEKPWAVLYVDDNGFRFKDWGALWLFIKSAIYK